jgi:cytochrome oxidase Cu insertion factor (SCO1/SenC/PrrC family)
LNAVRVARHELRQRWLVLLLGLFVRAANGTSLEAGEPGALATGRVGSEHTLTRPFSLHDADGQPVSLTDPGGNFLLIYFGYIHCTDFCPMGLSQMLNALRQLGDASLSFQPILITVDPERDSGATLRDYTARFDKRIVGLTGTHSEIEAFARSVGVEYDKVMTSEARGYVVEHSVTLTLVYPDRRRAATFKLGESYKIAARLKAALDEARIAPRHK